MPKKSIDYGKRDSFALPYDKVQNKTERSHEENQERAYIAASRRADRSLEARVQSARMASDIHKKRTGKGFRVSEEIVMKEEMYEEEEDEFPRSYRLLGPHMQTTSQEMNSRVEAYLTNKVAMSRLVASTNDEWRQNEINKLFAQSFPNANRQAQQMTQRMSEPSFTDQHDGHVSIPQSPVSVTSPTFQPITYQLPNQARNGPHQSLSPIEPGSSGESALSPTGLASPLDPHTPAMPATNEFASMMAPGPAMDFDSQSAFTSELPPEAKMLMGGMDMNQTFDHSMFDQSWMDPSNQFYDSADLSKGFKLGDMSSDPSYPPVGPDDGMNTPVKWEHTDQTNAGLEEPAWDSFLDSDAWVNEQ